MILIKIMWFKVIKEIRNEDINAENQQRLICKMINLKIQTSIILLNGLSNQQTIRQIGIFKDDKLKIYKK